MAEEAIPFVLLFIPLALRLRYDSLIGVSLPFLGSQVGFATAFLNPFNVGIAQGIAGVPVFSGMGYRLLCWLVFTVMAIGFLMWHAARIQRNPALSPAWALDEQRRASLVSSNMQAHDESGPMSMRHRLVLLVMALSLAFMIQGVASGSWGVEHLSALFLAMALLAGGAAGLSTQEWIDSFVHGARDMVSTALLIAMAKGTVVLMRDGQIIDSLLHGLAPLVDSGSPVHAAQKMFLIQSVINFFIHSGTGQAALTMPLMGPLADLAGISRQTAVLAFQFGELSTPIIPTSGITVGVMALSGLPLGLWVRWLLPLQLAFFVMALLLLVPPVIMGWT